MNADLWKANHPRNFWLCQPDPPEACWLEAVRRAAPILELPVEAGSVAEILALTLGEGQFGAGHWRLSPARRLYYALKPAIPRPAATRLRRWSRRSSLARARLGWPVERRYALFLWETLRQAMLAAGLRSIRFKWFWPEGRRFAFVLTHDVESGAGQAQIPWLAGLEEGLGFRSAFNFAPERYRVDRGLVQDLRRRGFEIGLHGLKHDGKLFDSERIFMQRARRINAWLKELGAAGFRAPLTQRQPEWMQALEIEYDLSFFDTDPFEPVPGGCMSIWPFWIGHFVELPYTLAQDWTLSGVLGQDTAAPWLEKIGFIERWGGMALGIVHPDYLEGRRARERYAGFLRAVQERGGCWQALPGETARWWRERAVSPRAVWRRAVLDGEEESLDFD